jgi:gamma-glutamyltranspeptidase
MVGAVVSGHPLSTRVGKEILARGGNAFDATIGVSAALTVVQPHMNGLGSDFFAVVHDGRLRSINGSGWAADAASIDAFRARGLRAIPASGPLASFTIPGLVASWSLLAPECTLRFSELVAPAARIAREGFPATGGIAASARSTAARADADWNRVYAGLRPNEPLRQAGLGRTLESVARDGGEGFYRGAIARRIDRDMEKKGGLLRASDLSEFRAEWTEPLRLRYRGLEVATTPPNSQGATALVWLNRLSREPLGSLSEPEYVARLAETLPVAYAYRARYIGDPNRVRFPPELLDPGFRFEDPSAVPGPASFGAGDTTAFSVSDGRNGVSAIQSNYHGFGSGHAVGTTGINLNNRGSYFTLDPAHHNALAPRRRTFHTLMAVAAVGPNRRILLGSMGGDVQPQVNVQILTRVLDRGQPIAEAIRAPRFAYPATIYGPGEWFREEGVGLPAARPSDDRDRFGHAHAIDEGRTTSIGIDPRGDGLG